MGWGGAFVAFVAFVEFCCFCGVLLLLLVLLPTWHCPQCRYQLARAHFTVVIRVDYIKQFQHPSCLLAGGRAKSRWIP
jgi:hypothetical protein